MTVHPPAPRGGGGTHPRTAPRCTRHFSAPPPPRGPLQAQPLLTTPPPGRLLQSGLGLVQSGGPLADIFEELRGAAGGLPGIGGIIGGLPPTDDIDIPTDIPTIPGGLPTNPQGIADLGRVALEAVAGRLNVPLPEGVLEDAGALGLLFTNIFSGGNFDATTLETLIAALLAAGGADLPTIPGFPLPTGRRMLRA